MLAGLFVLSHLFFAGLASTTPDRGTPVTLECDPRGSTGSAPAALESAVHPALLDTAGRMLLTIVGVLTLAVWTTMGLLTLFLLKTVGVLTLIMFYSCLLTAMHQSNRLSCLLIPFSTRK